MYHKLLKNTGLLMMIAGFVLALAGRGAGDPAVSVLAILLIFLSPLVMHLADRVRRKENEKNPVTEVEATVVGHRMETHHSRYSYSNTFYMTFKPEDGGETLEFEVPEADYQNFGAGDKGPLRYRTWEYLSFCAKDMSDVEPIASLPEEYDPQTNDSSDDSGWEQAEKLIDIVTEKAKELWRTAKEKCGEIVKSKPVQNTEEADQDDGILTHELDE